MSGNSKLVQRKQQRIQSVAKNCDSCSFFNILTEPETLSMVEELLPEEHRERQFINTINM